MGSSHITWWCTTSCCSDHQTLARRFDNGDRHIPQFIDAEKPFNLRQEPRSKRKFPPVIRMMAAMASSSVMAEAGIMRPISGQCSANSRRISSARKLRKA